jgi:hypothetical protein
MRRTTCILLAVLVATVIGVGTGLAKTRRPDKKKHFATSDIRIHIPKPKDMEGWTQAVLTQEQKEKQNFVLRLVLKKEGSTDPFDTLISIRAFAHNLNLTFTDPETGAKKVIPASNASMLSKHMTSQLVKDFKGIKDHKKLRKGTISRKGKIKGQVFSIMGLSGGMPQHLRFYAWVYQGKTYLMYVTMTTTAYKHEAISKMVNEMISKMVTWKP